MPESATIDGRSEPLTVASLTERLEACGLRSGQVVIVHSSLSSMGWVCGGQVAVIEALLRVLGPNGTLVMPAHSGGNSDPSHWRNPAVPEAWWPTIRASMPPFEPAKTPTRGMGAVAEAFRSWPGAVRSDHPATSFAARGRHADAITRDHDLEDMLGDRSPLGRLYEHDALILLLGVGHDSNTSLHLAEARADDARKRFIAEGAAVLVGGRRRWVRYRHIDWDNGGFAELGAAYESERQVPVHRVGAAEARLLQMRPLVDWGAAWLDRHR